MVPKAAPDASAQKEMEILVQQAFEAAKKQAIDQISSIEALLRKQAENIAARNRTEALQRQEDCLKHSCEKCSAKRMRLRKRCEQLAEAAISQQKEETADEVEREKERLERVIHSLLVIRFIHIPCFSEQAISRE